MMPECGRRRFQRFTGCATKLYRVTDESLKRNVPRPRGPLEIQLAGDYDNQDRHSLAVFVNLSDESQLHLRIR